MHEFDNLGLDYGDETPATPSYEAASAPIVQETELLERTRNNTTQPAADPVDTMPPVIMATAPVSMIKETQNGPTQPLGERVVGNDSVYRRRRMGAVLMICLVAVGAFLFVVKLGSKSPSPVAQTPRENATVPQVSDVQKAEAKEDLEVVLRAAKNRHAERETYVGFSYPEVKVASAKDMLVVSKIIQGKCFYSGVIPEKEAKVLEDPTNAACSDELITQTQTQFDEQTQQVKADSTQAASEKIMNAVASVQYYAQHNYENGVPSFSQIQGTQVEGVEISDQSATTLTLVASTEDGCLVTQVGVDSYSEPLEADCSQ